MLNLKEKIREERSSRVMERVLREFEEEHCVKSKRVLMWGEDYSQLEMSEEAKEIGMGRLYLVQMRKPHKNALKKFAAAIGWQI
jgi:hypothetical protein